MARGGRCFPELWTKAWTRAASDFQHSGMFVFNFHSCNLHGSGSDVISSRSIYRVTTFTVNTVITYNQADNVNVVVRRYDGQTDKCSIRCHQLLGNFHRWRLCAAALMRNVKRTVLLLYLTSTHRVWSSRSERTNTEVQLANKLTSARRKVSVCSLNQLTECLKYRHTGKTADYHWINSTC